MKKTVSILALAFIAYVIVLLPSCKNPLIGLGDKVDLEVPDISVTSHKNGDYVRGLFTMHGEYNDDFSGVSVRLSIDNGITFTAAAVDETEMTWSISIDTTKYSDGEKNVILIVEDASGKMIEKRILLYFDNTPPLVLVNVPFAYDPATYFFNGDVDIKGEAIDLFGISSVDIEVYDEGGFRIPVSEKIQGTSSWSFVFKSTDYVGVSGNFSFHIYAEDRAGNRSSYLYHGSDIRTANGGVSVGIVDLYAFDQGETVDGITMSRSAFESLRLDGEGNKFTLAIDQSLDLPVFVVIFPDPAIAEADNAFGSGLMANGLITDDEEGIDPSTVEIQIDGGPWVPVDSTAGSPTALNWYHDLSGLGEGPHTFRVRAEDNLGAASMSVLVSFRIDSGVPSVEVTSPIQGAYLDSSSFLITGTSFDTGSVSLVQVKVDAADRADATDTGGGDWSTWEFEVTGAGDGSHQIIAYVTDDTGKTAYYNLQVIVDTQFPTVTFLSPTKASSVNGAILLRGASSDNRQITEVEIKIGDSGTFFALPDLYNWEHLIDTAGYANAAYAVETSPGSNIWKLRVYARVTDIAGNTTETEILAPVPDYYYFFIDQELDKPRVTIISPPEGTVNVGGMLTVSGTAIDDDAIYRVEMQIDFNGDGDFADSFDYWDGVSNNPGNGTTDMFEDETQWYPVTGTTLWSQELNRYGELYNAAGGDGTVIVRVRAIDTKDGGLTEGIDGDIKEFTIHFDDTIPRIESLNISSGDYVKGVVNIQGDVIDDQEIKHIQISTNGGITYTNLDPSYYVVNDVNDYTLNLDIDTTPSGLNIESGILYLRLKVIDNANYQNITTLNLNVDNTPPTDDPDGYTADRNDLNGTSARVQGTARDSGIVSGIEKVEVYFIKSDTGLVYDPHSIGTGAPVPAGTGDFSNGSGKPYPTGAGANYKIVIDDTNEFGNDEGPNGDGDQFDESLTLAGSTYNWWAEFDSNLIPDGSIDIHYVIYDNAGNTGHYSVSGFITNNKPAITAVTVGSDVDWSGTVEGDEQFAYTGNFKARSRLYVGIAASDVPPGTIDRYEIIYDPDGLTPDGPLSMLDSAVQDDITYDITGFTDGSAEILIRVTDSDSIQVTRTLAVTIDNGDAEAPEVLIDPLDGTEATDDPVTGGHIELDSLVSATGIAAIDDMDPKVSGTLTISGTASDNQRVRYIRLTIDGFDIDGTGPAAAGEQVTVAQWSGNTLTPIDLSSVDPTRSNLVIDSQTLDESSGHTVNWKYAWNTALISNSATADTVFDIEVEDFSGIPSGTVNDDMMVDVVPYITRIDTGLTESFSSDFNRSALGRYPILIDTVNGTYESITVHGYNLNPQAAFGFDSDVRLSADPVALDIDGTTKLGSELAWGNVAAAYNSLDVDINVNGSGFLTILVNGIPTVNNVNDDTANSEANFLNPNLADNRYLSVWNINRLWQTVTRAQYAVYPSMALDGDTPEFAYVNNSQGWGQAMHYNGTGEVHVYENWDLFKYTAIVVNGDGDHGVLYDINVVNGNYGDYNSGNYGGILTAFYYPIPATSWNYWSFRFQDHQIWLDNLVDASGSTTAVLDRYQHPDIHMVGTTAESRVFYTVFDRLTNRFIYRTFRVGTNAAIDDVTGGRINDQAPALYTDIPQYEGDNTFPEYNGDLRFQNNNNAGKNPPDEHTIDSVRTSNFSAVSSTADGAVAMVVYYSESGTGSLYYKYNETPTNSGTWESIKDGVTDVALDTGYGGEYVDIAVDSTGAVHIAYYDNNNGDLRYIYLPTYDADISQAMKARVDSYFDVGDRLKIAVDDGGVPYISYKGISRSGRVAWLADTVADGTDGSNRFTGAWEIQTLPVEINTSDSNRFNIGIDTNGLPVVGYTNGGIEYIRLLGELPN